MIVSRSLAILISVLPFLATASAAHVPPPALRHRRAVESVRQITAKDTLHRAGAAPRANEAHRGAHRTIKKQIVRRGQCRPKPSTTLAASESSSTTTSSDDTETSTSSTWDDWSSSATATQSAIGAADFGKGHGSPTTTSTWSAPSSTTTWSAAATSTGSSDSGSSSGLLSITDNVCGWCDSSDGNPNGSEDWLNCGITGAGWTPPMVTIDQLIAAELDASGPYAPCAQYIDLFNQYGASNNVHPILLAAIAMQESTCNAGATGGNGEAGLMQIAPENCNNPSGDCYDVDYNINRGAELLITMINNMGGNVLAAIGSYNGWVPGSMTVASATAAASQGDCDAQNNLDYVYQIVNGWMQGVDGYSMGSYLNLAKC